MIERSGIKFFMDLFQEPITDAVIGFDFISGLNPNLVYPERSVTFGLTGFLNNSQNFYINSGYGNFNGNTSITFNKNINFGDNYTFLFSYEKLRKGDEILFSSFTGETSIQKSGFYVGINDANKIYFTYWNPVEGAFTFTYSKILSDKNLILINRNNDGLSIGKYNNNKKEFELETFEIYRNVIQQSNILSIGGNFSGLMDRFYLLNNVSLIYIDTIVSGLYASPSGAQGFTETVCYQTGYTIESGYLTTGITGSFLSGFLTGEYKITGTQQIQTGYCYQAVTGYRNEERGQFIDNCGRQQIIYEKIPLTGEKCDYWFIESPASGWIPSTGFLRIDLTGFLSGITGVTITGLQCDSFFVVTGDVSYIIDKNYLKSFSYSEASLIFNVNSNKDIIEIYKEPFNLDYLDYNQPLRYNSLFQNYFYLDRVFNTPNEILLFANGQVLIDSGYRLEYSGYEEVRIPNFDYFLTGDYIETERNFGDRDFLFYDYFTGDFNAFIITGHTSGDPINIDFSNRFVYLNGQKLVSGVHYHTVSGHILNINLSGNNVIVTKKISNNLNYISGNIGTLSINNEFNNYCSQLYFNGVRQKLFNNYIENSKFDKISGTFNVVEFPDILYNNTNDFFENTPES
jgi:hypothetical protein